MSTQFFPLEGCLATATAVRTAMAASVAHLFQSTLTPNPDPSTPTATYTANEATFDGYAAITMTTWNPPILAPGTGYMIGSPLVQFAWEFDTEGVGNSITGCYILDATGKNRMVIIFTNPIPMQIAGQGIPLNVVWLFPTGQ